MRKRKMDDAAWVLIIDDELHIRTTLAAIFNRQGYRVATAEGLPDALEALQRQPFDLAFLDLRLAHGDGMSLLPQMLRCQPGLPVVILTALVSVQTAEEALRLGARGYLLKPVDPEIVIARARDLISERSLSRIQREISSEIRSLHL